MIALSILLAIMNYTNVSPIKTGTTYLVKSEVKNVLTADQLKRNYSNLAYLVKNGYSAYRITYNTKDVKGDQVVASGAVFIPDSGESFPVLTYNHGTYFPSAEYKAPSYMPAWNPEMAIGKLFSAAGYIVVMPDYIGYGSTKELKHPYGAYHHIASTVVDMLKAVNELCKEKKVGLSGKTFFSGWSEGAAVSLATVRQLEQQPIIDIIPSATVVNAGPYHSTAFVNHVLDSDEPLQYMSSYAWVLQSYNWVYNINKPFEYYFTQPAAKNLEDGPEASISHDPRKLFTEEFRKNFKAGNEKQLEKALSENDLWNWVPKSRLVLCHGDKDNYVPLFNSEKAYKEMKSKGADVTLKVFKGHNHSSGALNFLEVAFSTFESMK